MTVPLLTIGAFARAVGLTSSALRHYDECGLLPPAEVDGATGYRYYTPALADRARILARLRALGVPVEAMRAVLHGTPGEGRAALRGYVDAQEAKAAQVSTVVDEILHDLDEAPERAGAARITLAGPVLASALRQVDTARAKEDSSPLRCVVVDVGENSVDVAATNRYWLAVRTIATTAGAGRARCVLRPSDATVLAARLDSCDEVDVEFVDGDLIVAGSTYRGDACAYPAHRLIVDGLEPAGTRCVLAREQLEHAIDGLRRAELTVTVGADGFTVSGRGDDRSTVVTATVSGPPMTLHLSGTLLARAVGATVGPEIRWELTAPDRPVRISSAYQPGFVALLMPLGDPC